MALRKIFPIFFIQFFILGLGSSIVGPLIPILADNFKVNLTVIGFALSLNAFGTLLATILTGISSERFGKKKVFILGSILFTTGFLGLYLSNNFIYFVLSYIIFGISWGMIYVNSVSIISDVSQLNSSKAIIRLTMGFLLGASFAPLLVSGILFLNINWRYLLLPIASINVILLMFTLSFKIDRFYKREEGKKFKNLFITNRNLLLNLVIILSGVIVFLHFGLGTTFVSWFTTYFKNLNVPVSVGSMILSLYWLIVCLGTFFKSFLVVKFNEKKVALFSSILALIFLIISFFTDWLVLKIIFILLFGFSFIAITEILVSISIKQSPKYSGSITSIIMSCAWIGVIIFQYTTGYLTENISGESLIYIILIALFISIVFISILNYATRR